jgi:hypothetical protein
MSENHMSLPSLAWYATVDRITDFFLKYQKLFDISSRAGARGQAKRFLILGIPVSCKEQGIDAPLDAYRKKVEKLEEGERRGYLEDLDRAFADAREYQKEKEYE